MVEPRDEPYMDLALREARRAARQGEVPIGAVLVRDHAVIARAHNTRERTHDPTAHAEVMAMRRGARRLASWRLVGCTLYVTLEPCLMCMGAAVQARLPRLVFGCLDSKAGAAGSLYEVQADARLNHRIAVTPGVREAECRALLQTFFETRRARPGSVGAAEGWLSPVEGDRLEID
ncbi:MAG: tRNA adenosine(34) deaminase TadA [Deltaproteobacteria bacterium]|nr:tRNA adenosine(34) deaminase TadA [Deltaproteobacteria bacterium]